MSVGLPATAQSLNQRLGQLAVQMHNLMQQVTTLQQDTTALGTGGLEAAGFSAGDASAFQADVSYMNTVAGCYFGTVQQGGSGGTGAIDFDFSNALAGARGGQ